MYGLPKNFDPTRLIGKELWEIGFGKYIIFFVFEKELSISVESGLSYQSSPDTEPEVIEFPVTQSDLMQLLLHSIVDAFGDDEGTLTLKFDNGHVLQFFDQPHYEAYQLRLGDEEIIV